MVTERNGSSRKYVFNATKIKRVPNADAVIIHTRQNMDRYVKPMKLANEREINGLKAGDQLKHLVMINTVNMVQQKIIQNFGNLMVDI